MIRYHHRITNVAALTLGVLVCTAPAAWAMPIDGGYASVNQRAVTARITGAALPHDPRPRSVALASSYGSAKVTSRTPATTASCGDVCSGHGYGPISTPSTVVRVVAPNGGFEWGDAGIGAAAAIALIAFALAGTRAATNGRRHIRRQRAAANG
jgi:hypothetical protein